MKDIKTFKTSDIINIKCGYDQKFNKLRFANNNEIVLKFKNENINHHIYTIIDFIIYKNKKG